MTRTRIISLGGKRALIVTCLLVLFYAVGASVVYGQASLSTSLGAVIGSANILAAVIIGGWAARYGMVAAMSIILGSFFLRLLLLTVSFYFLVNAGIAATALLMSFAASMTVALIIETIFLLSTKE